jgi:hypothetical protein
VHCRGYCCSCCGAAICNASDCARKKRLTDFALLAPPGPTRECIRSRRRDRATKRTSAEAAARRGRTGSANTSRCSLEKVGLNVSFTYLVNARCGGYKYGYYKTQLTEVGDHEVGRSYSSALGSGNGWLPSTSDSTIRRTCDGRNDLSTDRYRTGRCTAVGDLSAVSPTAMNSHPAGTDVSREEQMMSSPSVIFELECKLSKLRETAQGTAFQSVWPESARRQMINEILDTQRRLDAARCARA